MARVLAWIRDRGQRPFRRHQRGVSPAKTVWTQARLRKISDAIKQMEIAPFDLAGRPVGINEFEAAAGRRRNDVTFDSAAVMTKWPKAEPRPLLTSVDLTAPTIPFMGAAVMLYLRRAMGEILVDPGDIERVRDDAPKALAALLDRRELTVEGKRGGIFENLLGCWHGADIYSPTDSFIAYGSSGWGDRPEGDTLKVGHGANATTWTNLRLPTSEVLLMLGPALAVPPVTNAMPERLSALIESKRGAKARAILAAAWSRWHGRAPEYPGVERRDDAVFAAMQEINPEFTGRPDRETFRLTLAEYDKAVSS